MTTRNEYYVDPSSGQLSASRWGLKKTTVYGILAGFFCVIGGLLLNSTGIVAAGAGIFTSIAATNATVCFGSTKSAISTSHY